MTAEFVEEESEIVFYNRDVPLVPRLFVVVDGSGVLDDRAVEVVGVPPDGA
jgi:hypothetical protein